MSSSAKDISHSNCMHCKDNHDIEISEDLLAEIHSDNVVLFVGGGVSTENRKTFPFTFYEDICQELNVTDKKHSFPDLMSRYCKIKGSRHPLIKRISERFNYIKSWPALYEEATRFHKELSLSPFFNTIVTTNWDDFFESTTHAQPFVDDQDIVFWKDAKRKVLKIHGSINNLGSLVITHEDYLKCAKKLDNGLIGSQLKLILANKTIVFIGYSFNDFDFEQIYKFIHSRLGDFRRKAYMVTLDHSKSQKWEKLNLQTLITDGTFFLKKIRYLSEKTKCLIPLTSLLGVAKDGDRVSKIHLKTSSLDSAKYPAVLFCLSYQDGLLDAFSYFFNKVSYGLTLSRHRMLEQHKIYERLLSKSKSKRKWWDYSYIQGYMNGIMYFLADDIKHKTFFPNFFNLSGSKYYFSFNDFKRSLGNSKKFPPGAIQEHKRFRKDYNLSSGEIAPQHSPFLFGIVE